MKVAEDDFRNVTTARRWMDLLRIFKGVAVTQTSNPEDEMIKRLLSARLNKTGFVEIKQTDLSGSENQIK